MQRIEMADLQTIAASYATACVHRTRLEIYCRRLAVLLAKGAVLAFLLIHLYAHEGETADEREYRSYRTDRVAIGSSVTPRQETEYAKCQEGNDKCSHAPHP